MKRKWAYKVNTLAEKVQFLRLSLPDGLRTFLEVKKTVPLRGHVLQLLDGDWDGPCRGKESSEENEAR